MRLGCLYWSLASQQDPVHRAQSWSEGIPSQNRDQQEDLQNWRGLQNEGWQGKVTRYNKSTRQALEVRCSLIDV